MTWTSWGGDHNLVQRIEADIAEASLPTGTARPGVPILVTPANRQLLRSWLIANGVDVNRATKTSDGTLAAAWKSPHYLSKMEKSTKAQTDGQSIDLDAEDVDDLASKLLEATDQDPDRPVPSPSASDLDDLAAMEENRLGNNTPAFRAAKVIPEGGAAVATANDKSLSVSLDALTRAADKVLTTRLQDATLKLRQKVVDEISAAKHDLAALQEEKIEAAITARIEPVERVIVVNPQTQTKTELGDHTHPEFPTLLTALSCGLHVMLVGGASSGKTTAAREVARILGRPFEITGAVASAFELKGYEDGAGHYHPSSCRRAVEHGAVFLCDEWNRSVPPAQMFMQAGLANNIWPFPDRTIESHPDFLCIAADNTSGTGQDRLYVTANQQDAAALDRWVYIRWEIDEWLEAKLFGDGQPEPQNIKQPDFSTHFGLKATSKSSPSPLQAAHAEFCTCLSALNKIQAMKVFRYASGCTLDAARIVVEGFLDGTYITTKISLGEFRGLCEAHSDLPLECRGWQLGPDQETATAITLGDWVRRVQRIRHAIQDLGERHLVTMRASDYGGRLLKAGLDLEKVEQMTVWKGLGTETIAKIKHHANLD